MLFYRLLLYAAATAPLTHQQLVANRRPKKTKPTGLTVPVLGPAALPVHLSTAPGELPPHSNDEFVRASALPAVTWITHLHICNRGEANAALVMGRLCHWKLSRGTAVPG